VYGCPYFFESEQSASFFAFQLSLAALAVVCRGFLNMAAFSRDAKASNKLMDIINRWSATERILGTSIEALPLLLVIPVLLFIAGLLDTLFSNVLRLSSPPASILAVSGISLFFFCALVSFLIFATVDGSLNPTNSPFQTTLSHIIRARLHPALSSLFSRPLPHGLPPRTVTSGNIPPRTFSAASSSSNGDVGAYELALDAKIYHEVIQATHDDATLDQASAALFEVIRRSVHPADYPPRMGPLVDEEHATLLHLLSPEASIRSSRTAAQVIIRLHDEYCEPSICSGLSSIF
jgi:hypothetical protein